MSSAPVSQPKPQPLERFIRPFWPTVWLVLALVAIKASYVELSSFWVWATLRDYFSWLFTQWVAAATQADALFALGAGILVAAMLLIARRRERLVKLISAAFLLFGAVCVVYAIIGRQVFAYYHAPLTYQLLSLGGEPMRLRSSLEPYLTWQFLCAVAGLPAVYLLLSWTTWRIEGFLRPAVKIVVRIALCVAVVAWFLVGRQLLGSNWFEAQDRHMVDSPHWTLLRSGLSTTLGLGMKTLSAKVLPEDVREFSMAPQNPASGAAQAALLSGHGARPRNVILLVLESVGTRYLTLYGSDLQTTPRLMAEQGNAMVFDGYYAPVAWTAYSLISLTLSKRPPMVAYNELSFSTGAVQGASLATVLRGHGYRTGFLAAGDPDWASGGFLQKNGFQEVLRGKDLPGAKQISSWGTTDGALFSAMQVWIHKNSRQPFFLMAWTDQTHHPYKLAAGQTQIDLGVKGKDGSLDRYANLIREADTHIGELLENLRETGLAEETLVVVTGDHGEAFGQPHAGSGHGFTVYDEEVRVPLMFWNPHLFHGKDRLQVVGSHPDLAPTVLDVLGLAQPAGWDGRSLLAPDRLPHTYLFAAGWGQYLLGVRDGDWKYIYDVRGGHEELYDLASDPNEQHNLAAAHPDRSGRLRQRLAAWLEVERQRDCGKPD